MIYKDHWIFAILFLAKTVLQLVAFGMGFFCGVFIIQGRYAEAFPLGFTFCFVFFVDAIAGDERTTL